MKKNYSNPVGVSKYTGLLLTSPFIIGFLVFILCPFIMSFLLGLTDYDYSGSPDFIGFGNFREMFSNSEFRNSALVTLKYAAILVPLKLIVSLFTALLLSLEIKGIGFFRTAFYVPSILGANLSVVIMWQYLFTGGGLVNQLLELIGFSPVSWYGEPSNAMAIIVLLRLWEFGSTMIIFLNALKEIPTELYDAAKVDGCGKIGSFFAITLPMLKKTIFINLILQIIAAVQEFNAPYMLTKGGPLKSTYTMGMYIYDEMFVYNNVGYANAVSWVMFAALAVIIAAMYAVSGKAGRSVR
ncbi:MAG: sugar ABC transporter permease [Oscillospiraceae bacterium]|nr:sugar ABC transporter permease [Oscillospiraceae bacterium]